MTGLKITVPGRYWHNVGWATGPALVRQEFVLGVENAFWIDPSDLSTLFQDRAGTIPVTQHGDPVSLALDKSGQGRDMVLHTEAAAQPVYMTDGFRHWIDVPAGGDFIINNNIPLTDRTLIVAFRLAAEMAGGDAQVVMQGRSQGQSNDAYLTLDLRRWGGVLGSNTHTTAGIELQGTTPLLAETDLVATLRMDTSAPYSDIRLNGVLEASHTLEPDTLNGMRDITHVFNNADRDRSTAGRLYGLAYARAFRDPVAVESIFAQKAGINV